MNSMFRVAPPRITNNSKGFDNFIKSLIYFFNFGNDMFCYCERLQGAWQSKMKFLDYFTRKEFVMTKGFTLAEILITLSILGIIAVISIPNIVNNINQRIYISRWKQAYSDIERVAAQISMDYHTDKMSDAIKIAKNKTGHADIDVPTTILRQYFNAEQVGVDNSSRYNRVSGSPFDCTHNSDKSNMLIDGSDFAGSKDNSSRWRQLNGKSTIGGYGPTGYGSAGCIKTKNYVLAYKNNLIPNNLGHSEYTIFVKTTTPGKGGIIGKDIFAVSISDLNKVKPAGAMGFMTTAKDACNNSSTTERAGYACSAKYLYGK